MEPTDDLTQIKELEKKVRTLERKLTRSETDRQELETASELREVVLKNVIREFEESKIVLEDRGDDLEATLINLKALQIKLVESEKMSALGVLVAGVAHEIDNPVSFIYGNLSYAKAHLQDLLRLVHLCQQQYPEPTATLRQELEVRSKLFDPFFTTTQVGKGSGLGLAIARQIIVEQHQGSLEVSSVVGQGSEFVIKLPVP